MSSSNCGVGAVVRGGPVPESRVRELMDSGETDWDVWRQAALRLTGLSGGQPPAERDAHPLTRSAINGTQVAPTSVTMQLAAPGPFGPLSRIGAADVGAQDASDLADMMRRDCPLQH
jgi:hypothetical protein